MNPVEEPPVGVRPLRHGPGDLVLAVAMVRQDRPYSCDTHGAPQGRLSASLPLKVRKNMAPVAGAARAAARGESDQAARWASASRSSLGATDARHRLSRL